MDKKDYIKCKNLAKVDAIEAILEHIMIAGQDEIQFSDYHDVVMIVNMWQERLNDSINIESD